MIMRVHSVLIKLWKREPESNNELYVFAIKQQIHPGFSLLMFNPCFDARLSVFTRCLLELDISVFQLTERKCL